jgi:hypothetical protein
MDEAKLQALTAETHKALATFLNAEITAGLACVELARTRISFGNMNAATGFIQRAQWALDTVQRFRGRMSMLGGEDRKQVDDGIGELKEGVGQSWEKAFRDANRRKTPP